MKLPRIPFSKSIFRPEVQTEFYGLNHNISAGDGELYDMENLTARFFPVLATREKRILTDAISGAAGAAAQDVPCWISRNYFYYDGNRVGENLFTAADHSFAFMGSRVIIFPEKYIYNSDQNSLSSMEASAAVSAPVFTNGVSYGEQAYANTIYAAGVSFGDYFKAGDAVEISGCTVHPENNKTAVIREISGNYMYFSEFAFALDNIYRYTTASGSMAGGAYCFTIDGISREFTVESTLPISYLSWDGTSLTMHINGDDVALYTALGSNGTRLEFSPVGIKPYTEPGTVTIARTVPDLDHICINENRLWGCRGDKIYASKLGDPFNFNVIDGLDTDSWTSETVDAGDFTACVSYMGYPIFFKENSVYKVYGDKPANFQWTPSARLGVKAGCHKSLAVAAETLFYVSTAGVCAYNGGIPSVISEPLGVEKQWSNAAAGSDGTRYYVSMSDGTAHGLYVYDTSRRTWHREDDTPASDFWYCDNSLFMLTNFGTGLTYGILLISGDKTIEGAPEVNDPWAAEFADSYYFYKSVTSGSENKKGLLRLQVRCELDTGATMQVQVMYDSSGEWETVYALEATAKKSFNIPLILRRCDHFRLKFSGSTGSGEGVRIYSITKVRYAGSNLQ